ncbi:MAG TPA: hypothetical protein VLW53_02360 [Candidatus Eisenbacteria bacterium]|nr:hypothetical protein [Candidatus Eisenbacteria bacterium]
MVRFAAAAAGVAMGLAAATGAVLLEGYDLAGLVLGMLTAVAAAVVGRTALRLRRWPTSRLGFFRDRLVLVQGRRTQLQARWEQLDTVTLADQGDWATARWPEITLTDRLTVRMRPARRFSFRPATFGVEPAACRDLMLRLRDEPELRARLPEFDAGRDLASMPLHTGDLVRPEL